MHTHTFLVAAVAAALFAGAVRAQTFRPLPAYADAVDGHRESGFPFGRPGFRTQILVDGARLAANGAILTGIALRANRAHAGLTTQVPNVTVTVSHTSVAIGAMTTTFANNVTGPVTTVFQGTVTLPAQGVVSLGPLPWNVTIPFAQPYSYTTAGGNLLIDIVGNNPASGGVLTYMLDAVQAGGSATEFGAYGFTPNLHTLLLHVPTSNGLTPRLLSPGHTIQFISALVYASSSAVASPGVLGLGTGGLPTPFDLGPLGAPSNLLYVDTLLCPPHSWVPWLFGVSSTFAVPVPNAPAFVGATIYAQAAVFVPVANPLGLVVSNAVETRIGDEFEVLPLQQLDVADPLASTGVLLRFYPAIQPEYGAVAIRFEGAFF